MFENRRGLAVVGLVGLFLLAGCGGMAGIGGPTVSDPHTDVVDGTPAIVFNYSVSDYTTVLLQGPDGQVINKGTLEPNESVGAIAMREPKPGTYKIILQKGGETAAEKSVSFNGSNPSIQSVSAEWAGNSLQSVHVTIENTGDTPVRVSQVDISAKGDTIDGGYGDKWIAPNSAETVTVSPSYQSIEVTEPGDVDGLVSVSTSNGTVTGSFRKTFEGANLSITDTSMTWDGNTLTRVTVTVENTGDLPTDAEPEVRESSSETLASALGEEIPPGESKRFDITGLSYIYEASSGGNVSLSLIVDSSSGFEKTELTHYVEPSSVEIVSISPEWQNGKLMSISYTLENTGETKAEFSMSLTSEGSELGSTTGWIEGDTVYTFTYSAGAYSTEPIGTVTEGGSVPLTVSITSDGETVSKTETREFEGISGSIIGVDITTYSQFDSDLEDFSSLSLTVRNSGDIPLAYDSVKLTIDGTTRTESLVSSTSLDPGASEKEYISLSQAIAISSGEHQLEITLMNNGEAVLSETVTVSTG